MEPSGHHSHTAHSSFDGGDLDCGNGLLLLIREHLDKLDAGQLLEIRSIESSVENDLPSWCRLTKNDLVSWTKDGKQRSFLVSKGPFNPAERAAVDVQDKEERRSKKQPKKEAKRKTEKKDRADGEPKRKRQPKPKSPPSPNLIEPKARQERLMHQVFHRSAVERPANHQEGVSPHLPPLAVMGIGSWPRPRWLLSALHEYLEGRMSHAEFQEIADDAVRLCVARQMRAGVDVITDGEQRRDNYASFVGKRLQNC